MRECEMVVSFDKHLVGPWVFDQVGKQWAPEGREAIGVIDDCGHVICGVAFEDFTGASASVHIALSGPHAPIRKLLPVVAGYAFNQLGLKKLIGLVPSTNLAALKFDLRIGFKPEAVIKDVYPDGDMVIMSMTRDDCSFIPRKVA